MNNTLKQEEPIMNQSRNTTRRSDPRRSSYQNSGPRPTTPTPPLYQQQGYQYGSRPTPKKRRNPFAFIFSLLCFIGIAIALLLSLTTYFNQQDLQNDFSLLTRRVDTLSSVIENQEVTPSSSMEDSTPYTESSSTESTSNSDTSESTEESEENTENSTEKADDQLVDGYYTVGVGDNLSEIAETFDLSLETLMEQNDLEDAVIYEGQELFIK